MDKQVIKDIKLLLIYEIMYWDDYNTTSESIWESDKKFNEIANRYGITKENIYNDLTEEEKLELFC